MNSSENLENKSNYKKALFFILDIAVNVVILVALVFLIRNYFITPFRVYGPSMCNTINFIDGKCTNEFGEYLIVDKFSYKNFFGWQLDKPQRGDIIVFHPPASSNHEDESYIKRIIGLPGDSIVIQDGKIYLFNEQHPKGYELEEKYLNTKNQNNTQHQQWNLTKFKVPAGKYFVMGDNRMASTDSRSCFKRKFSDPCADGSSYISLDQIQGKAWVSLWPLSKVRIIKEEKYPTTFPPVPSNVTAK